MAGSNTEIHTLQTLNVEGMTCANCAMGIQRSLQKKGLSDVQVSFTAGEVNYTPVEGYNRDAIIHDIEQLGYSVKRNTEAETPSGGWGKLEKLLLFCTICTIPLWLHMFWPAPLLMNPFFQLALCVLVMVSEDSEMPASSAVMHVSS
jgi:Cu+-exporting ATPase